MGKLIYAINTSLDGFTEDVTGAFDWSEPDEDVHMFFNDMMRGVGTQLLGRRMYETMAVWETEPSFAEESASAGGAFGFKAAVSALKLGRLLGVQPALKLSALNS